MTDEAKGWIVEGLKGTSLFVIIMGVASVVWVVADISGQLRSTIARVEAIQALGSGSRLTALELQAKQQDRETERLDRLFDKKIEQLGRRIDRLNSK